MPSAQPQIPAAAPRDPKTPAETLPQPLRPGQRLRFGHFELDASEHRLLARGELVHLQARAMDLLIALAGQAGQLLSRQQLLDRVWPGLVVEENNLSVQINALRKVLGADVIATVPGRGYRFAAGVEPLVDRRARLAALPATQRPTHLPDSPPPLIGRAADLAALLPLLADHALVTVTGAGGVGKTSLAVALLQAQRQAYPHGVCLVELAGVQQAEAVPRAIAAALALRLSEEGEPLPALAQALAPLNLLVALDNAEHLVEAVAAVAEALLDAAPGVRLLVTSQAPLRLRRERVYRLGPLGWPDPGVDAATALGFGAVALFVARVQALDQRFQLDAANVDLVAELCRRLDGSALAIELAAARVPLLGLAGLHTSLGQRLSLLSQGQRDAPARQQTLRAALQWSHDLLGPAERQVFRRLAVFAGSAPLALLQAVLPDAAADDMAAWAVLDALAGLVDRSLVALMAEPGDAQALPRYRLLESPRALAVEQLARSGELAGLQRLHAHAVCALFERGYLELLEGAAGLENLRESWSPDIDNAHAALRWALAHDAALAVALAPLLSLALGRQRHAERAALWSSVESLLAAPGDVAPLLLARAHWQCAEHGYTTRTRQAMTHARRARALALDAGDARLAYLCLGAIAPAGWRLGEADALREAAQAAAEVPAALVASWPAYVRAAGAAAQAWLCCVLGDTAGSLAGFTEQARLYQAAGIDDALVLNNVAGIHLTLGASAETIRIAGAVAERQRAARDQFPLAISLLNLSAALLTEERASEAAEVARQSWPLARQFEMHPQWADDAALIAALQGRGEDALRLAGFADAAFAALGQPREAVDQRRIDRAAELASVALAAGQDAAACARLRASGERLKLDELPMLAFGAAA